MMRVFFITVVLAVSLGVVHAHFPIISSALADDAVTDGLDELSKQIDLPTSNLDIRDAIIKVILFILSFLALIAVIMIIIAGFVLILGAGSESSVTRARKIIIYTIVGLVIIFFARVIVGFFTSELPSYF